MVLETFCILEAASLFSSSSLSSYYLYRGAGMKILIFPKSAAALLPFLQLLTPPFPLHHIQASQQTFPALLPLCCSFTSTSLIVPPTLSCHIVPYSLDLTIERKKEGIQWRRMKWEVGEEEQRKRTSEGMRANARSLMWLRKSPGGVID